MLGLCPCVHNCRECWNIYSCIKTDSHRSRAGSRHLKDYNLYLRHTILTMGQLLLCSSSPPLDIWKDSHEIGQHFSIPYWEKIVHNKLPFISIFLTKQILKFLFLFSLKMMVNREAGRLFPNYMRRRSMMIVASFLVSTETFRPEPTNN